MAFNRLFIDGTLLGGVERFSVGIAFATGDDGAIASPPLLNAWAENALTYLKSAAGEPTNLRQLLGSNGGISRVRTYFYGGYNQPASFAGTSTGIAGSGANSVTMPPQCSLVLSLVTNFAGRRYRGRVYWPHLTGTIGADGKRSGNPNTAVLASSFATVLRQLAVNSGNADLDPVVVSQAGAGATTAVVAVSIGDVVDTQRRRRDALVEIRSTAAVPV